MNLVKSLLIICALVLALCATTEAKTTDLRKADNGILGAMNRAELNCAPEWLATIMKSSGILESELYSLPEGTPITAPDNCTTTHPSKADLIATRRIFARASATPVLPALRPTPTPTPSPALTPTLAPAPPPVNASLPSQIDGTEAFIQNQDRIINELGQQNDQLRLFKVRAETAEGNLSWMTQQLQKLEEEKRARDASSAGTGLAGLLIGLALGIGATYLDSLLKIQEEKDAAQRRIDASDKLTETMGLRCGILQTNFSEEEERAKKATLQSNQLREENELLKTEMEGLRALAEQRMAVIDLTNAPDGKLPIVQIHYKERVGSFEIRTLLCSECKAEVGANKENAHRHHKKQHSPVEIDTFAAA